MADEQLNISDGELDAAFDDWFNDVRAKLAAYTDAARLRESFRAGVRVGIRSIADGFEMANHNRLN